MLPYLIIDIYKACQCCDDVGDGQDASQAVQESTLIHLAALEVGDVDRKSGDSSYSKKNGKEHSYWFD